MYDDIDSLESDINEKDTFLQTVVKTRNACQSEIAILKKKNSELIKENNNLHEKNEQLDEDAETGLTFVRNAHERERKVNTELNDCRSM
jgi:FtsZ-binding cell division protein ZapB